MSLADSQSISGKWDLPELALKRLPVQDPDLSLWLAGPAPAALTGNLWAILAASEKERASRFHRPQDQALFGMTRAALRILLSASAGVAPGELAFSEGASGKPRLAGGGPQFNVSHSGSFALIGISPSRPVGVDIEAIRPRGDELDIARAFFSVAECRALEARSAGGRLLAFYQIWTCKEAVLKACGRGIGEHLSQFSVEVSSGRLAIRPEPCCSLAIASFAIGPAAVPEGYAGCYALA